MNNKEIGKFLQTKRKENNMTQNDLAMKLNVTYQAVSRWETGESIPDIQTLDAIALLYNISIDDILQRSVTKEKDKNEMKLPLLITLGVIVSHMIGVTLFYLLSMNGSLNVGLLAYFLFVVVSLFIQNMFYLLQEKKTNRLTVIYAIGYLPLVISLLIIAARPGLS